MMDELIAAVGRAANLSPDQAALAVTAVLRFFTARLPSSLVGELHAQLQTGMRAPRTQSTAAGAAHDPESTP